MATFKVGSKAQAGSKSVEQTAPAPKTSFAETLAARTGAAKAPAQTQSKSKTGTEVAADPRAAQLQEMLEQQLVTTTRSIAKKANIQKEEAKGGMDGD